MIRGFVTFTILLLPFFMATRAGVSCLEYTADWHRLKTGRLLGSVIMYVPQ